MRRSLLLFPLLLGAATSVAACGGSGSSSASSAGTSSTAAPSPTITIDTFMFQPKPLQVHAGATIHVVNHDGINHSVTAGTRDAPTPAVFDHVLPGKDATFDLTLAAPGTYHFFCKFHPGTGMEGEIIVS